jgi:hypothetical protein
MLDIFMTSEARARRLERNLRRLKEQQRKLAEIGKPRPHLVTGD